MDGRFGDDRKNASQMKDVQDSRIDGWIREVGS